MFALNQADIGVCEGRLNKTNTIFDRMHFFDVCRLYRSRCIRKNEKLINAAFNNGILAVQTLLDKGAEVNAKDTYGTMALWFASQEGHKEVVKLLLEKGAEVKYQIYN